MSQMQEPLEVVRSERKNGNDSDPWFVWTNRPAQLMSEPSHGQSPWPTHNLYQGDIKHIARLVEVGNKELKWYITKSFEPALRIDRITDFDRERPLYTRMDVL